jgi:hypothetical protein
MLLSCFFFVYSATTTTTNENRPPDYGMETPTCSFEVIYGPRGEQINVLKYSPGTVEEKRKGLRERDVNCEDAPRSLDFGDECCPKAVTQAKPLVPSEAEQYLVYISLMDSGTGFHMTTRKTVVGKSIYEQLLTKLNAGNKRKGVWRLPCKIAVKLYRDPETGLMSPTHESVSRAFDTTPDMLQAWTEKTEKKNRDPNQPGLTVSELLSCIPADSPEFGYYPLGHTEQKACARGEEIVPVYTRCKIEISKVSSQAIGQMKKERFETVARLEECIKVMDDYLKLDAGAVLVGKMNFVRNNKLLDSSGDETIKSVVNGANAVVRTAKQLQAQRKKFYADFLSRYMAATQILQLIEKDYMRIYYELIADEFLRPSFVAAGPNIKACYEIATLWFTALQREMKQPR